MECQVQDYVSVINVGVRKKDHYLNYLEFRILQNVLR